MLCWALALLPTLQAGARSVSQPPAPGAEPAAGRHPDHQFISASASVTLAEDFGGDVRNLIASPEYAQVFDTRLAEDSQARGRWTTQEGGSYFATGVGGTLMGRAAHVLLIDDPFGSMADARSEIARKSVHEWFTGTCYNRLEKDRKIVLINHRMHQDDLSGRAAGGDQWTMVELKAVSSSGAALWPGKFDETVLARIKANITAQDWAALYQQEPTAESGSYFKDEWLFPHIDDPPKSLSVLLKSMGRNCINIGVVLERYADFCGQLRRDADSRLRELLAGQTRSRTYRCGLFGARARPDCVSNIEQLSQRCSAIISHDGIHWGME